MRKVTAYRQTCELSDIEEQPVKEPAKKQRPRTPGNPCLISHQCREQNAQKDVCAVQARGGEEGGGGELRGGGRGGGGEKGGGTTEPFVAVCAFSAGNL